ncbi:helix-turn-helix domain-containing protein [Salinibacterium sp. SYSU T00001]|uniref:helix-turn-helix domain-containing protein n=1 Tax=Homoserinimonas sedimenticola TaxID=2986805 RepID=UPI00223546C4|nr:helix-turn-helix domain-containing protein [Salinibacterium sedimenticola]MCW4385190.1 helix-turn-helix domain-containing protein [Salinibacterium sedimenticola]
MEPVAVDATRRSSASLAVPLKGLAAPVTFSTARVRPEDRLARWEEYNERELFGLRVSTLSGHGLLAKQTNLDLRRLRFTEIVGNDHVIERTPRNIAQKPVDAIMLCLLLEGDAFFYHSDGCETLTAGDAVIYDTERPFMYGFSSAMRQVILELPRTLFEGRMLSDGAFRPRVLRLTDSASATNHARTATRAVLNTLQSPPQDSDSLEESVLDLFGLIAGQSAGSPSTGYLLSAKDFIRTHLRESDLSVSRVARAVGLSERHLARVFADDATTLSRYVLDARLARARDLLTANRDAPIAELAASVGFVSAAHFARAFRQRYGCTPSDVRAGD